MAETESEGGHAPPKLVDQREYERMLDTALFEQRSSFSQRVRSVIEAEFDADTADAMMKEIDPILAAGKEGRRRERAVHRGMKRVGAR